MPENEGGVCYANGEVVKENFQNCEVKNKMIRKMLEEKVPEVTFTCKKEDETCDFQCKPTINPLTVDCLTHYSLDRPTGILLLWSGCVQLEHR
jgi:hypothetical protein